mmetsp:Transcript_93985/g.251607  ORF Transcript_93985/g.251607 Transcript_93985/m.251607 type:complete len:222 (-) Transcript_93985:112-777(-)
MDLDEDVRNFFRARRTTLQMLRDRGYTVQKKLLEQTFTEFKEIFQSEEVNGNREHPNMVLYCKKPMSDDRMIVYFCDEKGKTGVKPVETLANLLINPPDGTPDCMRGIIVVRSPLTPFAKQAVSEAGQKLPGRTPIEIDVFLEAELLVNLTECNLVPKHEVMSEDLKEQVLKRYSVKDSQLPRIQFTDPMARYFGLRRGEVVKIIRASETAGRYVTYRLCV